MRPHVALIGNHQGSTYTPTEEVLITMTVPEVMTSKDNMISRIVIARNVHPLETWNAICMLAFQKA